MINLIGNALKFTDTGHVSFGYKKTGNELEFFVEDTGVGIPQDKKELVFQRFKQIEATKSSINSGTGLGLAISKSIVELLGGEIWLESEFGAGSSFYFTIPYHNDVIENIPSDTIQAEPAEINLVDKKVLVAEDIELNFKILDSVLKKEGIRTTWARNGKEAVDLCKDSNFDLVLMDIRMPLMDGLEATTSIREFNRKLPIIAQTAYALENEKEQCFNAGCNDYISKPLNSKMLLGLMKKYMV